MNLLLLHDKFINITKLEQRLIQVFAYCIGSQFLHELMYLGMDYAFKFSNALNIENIKGNFYMSNLLYTKGLFNIKSLFKHILRDYHSYPRYNSFILFKKFYTIIHQLNPILNILDFIVQIGARSNPNQYQQVTGMRGFLNTSRGYLTTIPMSHNFERGLNLTEYIISSYGVRKGLLDTSLQTSESGYLTRRLVEVIQDIIIKEQYCGSDKFLILRKYNTIQGYVWFPNSQILFNKYLYNSTNRIEFYIKSPILCYAGRSVCAKCSGFSCHIKILGGESVGVICGELLGEPSTQLTLRTFHTGGILSITTENNFYTVKNKLTYKPQLSHFKSILFKTTKKNLQKFNINIINKFKFTSLSKFYKNLIYLSNKLSMRLSNLAINPLVIYKFNLFPQCPITISYSRNMPASYKTLIYNILLNVCSVQIIVKNKVSEWVILLLNNSLNYCLVDSIPDKFMGGIVLNKKNFEKSYAIFNTSLLY